MGLFDMFGAGGGTLTLVPATTQIAPGGALSGNVTFTGGKRSQNITSIKVRFVCEQRPMGAPGAPPPAPSTKDVVPEQLVSGAFQTQPGTPHTFPFQIQLPPQLAAEIKGQLDYKLLAAVDIPGEVDAHAASDIQVLGGMAMGAQPPMGAPMMGAPPIGVGASVLAQHPMGSWSPGRVVAVQNGMFGIDWDDAKLGQSTWVQAHQVQPGKAAMPQMPPPMGAPIQIGAPVIAQHPQIGGWHPGRVVALQNGMIGVDWADAKLGSSSWLQEHQVQHGK